MRHRLVGKSSWKSKTVLKSIELLSHDWKLCLSFSPDIDWLVQKSLCHEEEVRFVDPCVNYSALAINYYSSNLLIPSDLKTRALWKKRGFREHSDGWKPNGDVRITPFPSRLLLAGRLTATGLSDGMDFSDFIRHGLKLSSCFLTWSYMS